MNSTEEYPMDSIEDTPLYCGQGLLAFSASFAKLHNYITLVFCVFGSIGNLVNIVVLTHRRMRAPLDAIFTALAISHLLFLLDFLTYTLFTFLPQTQWFREEQSYYWVLYNLIHINFCLVLGLISTWLTLTLATWCTIIASNPQKKHLYTMRRAITIILTAFLTCPLLCIPLVIAFSITPGYIITNEDGNLVNFFGDPTGIDLQNSTLIHHWEFNEIGTAHDYVLITVNECIFGVGLRLVSCISLVVINALQCYATIKRKGLKVDTALAMSTDEDSEDEEAMLPNDVDQKPTTLTKLIVVMSVIFILPEILIATMNICCITLGGEFVSNCRVPLDEVITLTTLIYPTFTCYLYCKMWSEFWDTLIFIVKPKCLNRWWPETQKQDDIKGSTATQLTEA